MAYQIFFEIWRQLYWLFAPLWQAVDLWRGLWGRVHNTKAPKVKIAVVAHVHYPDVWPELAQHLDNIPCPFDLFVSVTADDGIHAIPEIVNAFPNAKIARCENRGLDILPFHSTLMQLSEQSYDLICKVHTKKSLHVKWGKAWREELLKGALGSRSRVLWIIHQFLRNPRLGMVGAMGCLTSEIVNEGSHTLHTLIERAQLQQAGPAYVFVAGTMFWFRPQALRTLRKVALTSADCASAHPTIDGDVTHAYERLIGMCVHSSGFSLKGTLVGRVAAFQLMPMHFFQLFSKEGVRQTSPHSGGY